MGWREPRNAIKYKIKHLAIKELKAGSNTWKSLMISSYITELYRGWGSILESGGTD